MTERAGNRAAYADDAAGKEILQSGLGDRRHTAYLLQQPRRPDRDLTEYTRQLAEKLKTKVFSDPIREGIAVKEAQINRRSLFDYAPKATATEDYAAFINELLEKEDKAK